jgi:xylulokinase
MYYIGYDVGSSSIKIALVDAKTNQKIDIVSEPEREMPIHAEQPDWAEQDPEMWWEYLSKGTKRILAKNNIISNSILAIGISYQMHGLVILDKNHKTLRKSIIWCDSRAVAIGEKAALDLGKKKFGDHLYNSPGNFTASKLKWVKENEPEIYDQIAYYMLPGDFIAFKLTGEITTTKNGLSEGILWDYKDKNTASWLLDYYGIDKDLTPPLVENFDNQGKVTLSASKNTGLPEGIPIRYRAGDQPNNALALNVLKPGEVAASGGTSGVLFAVSKQKIPKEFFRVNHFAHVNYTEENPVIGTLLCINGAGIQYSWLRKMIQISSFKEMNDLADSVQIGSDGLINLPFGNGVERMFYNQTPGAQFCNLNLNIHQQGHLCRAAIEGVAFSFAYGMKILKNDSSDIHVIRAGNDNLFKSEIFSNTIASLIDHPIEIYDTTGAIGAARAAGVENRSFEDFGACITKNDLVAVVDPKNENAYFNAYGMWKKELENKINNLNQI